MTKTMKNKMLVVCFGVIFFLLTFAFAFSNTTKASAAETFTPSGNICVEDGASIRVDSKENSGLRYTVYVEKGYFDGLDEATAGAIIMPQEY